MDDLASAGRAASLSSVLLFALAGRIYAIAMDRVRRVVEPQPLTRLPQLAAHVLGVAAIGGTVVPVLDLRQLLGVPEGGRGDDKELLLIAAGHDQYGLYVDRILQIGVRAASTTMSWNGAAVDFLDLDACIAAHAGDTGALLALAATQMTTAALVPASTQHDGLPVVSLAVETAGMRIFLPLDHIVELCETLPIVAVPDPRPVLIGAAFFRGALVPVIPLDALLGRSVGAEHWGGFVVLDVEGRRCALAVKRVIGRVPQSPAAIDLQDAICALLPAPKVSDLSGDVAVRRGAAAMAEQASDYLLAVLGGRTCAFALTSVAHLFEACNISRTPAGVHERLIGAVAIGGRVLPVLDFVARLGLEPAAATAMIEFKSAGGAFVVAVDRILGIASIASEALMPAPVGSAITAVVRRDDALLWIIDPSAIAELRESDAA